MSVIAGVNTVMSGEMSLALFLATMNDDAKAKEAHAYHSAEARLNRMMRERLRGYEAE